MKNVAAHRIISLLLFVATVGFVKAENLPALEDSVNVAYKALSASRSDDERSLYCEKMRNFFIHSFNDPAVFDYPFGKLNLCKLISSDQHIRLLNWNMPYEDGTFKYFCFVLVRDPETQALTWIELTDNQRETEGAESKFLTPEKWIGALYYEIIPVFEKRNKKNVVADTYILLGWDGKDNLTTRKIIDGLTITGSKLRLGVALFEMGKVTKKRVIYEYSNDVSTSVKYYPKEKCIVVDHLSPKGTGLEGIFAEYGPDGTYDLFRHEKGKWVLYENVDVEKFTGGDNRPYSDPRKTK
ncbi:MAG: hypothetical protein IT223_11740 [Crocinitomicaceae bacterium]|nr:hypothetical protein [Crocinitomicaceae bacterium]